MKAKEVMKLLNISRPTLCKYVKEGKIAVKTTPGGQYIYDSDSVYKLLTKHSKMNVIYARVSTPKQKSQLENQVEKLTEYCTSKNINISEIFRDIASGLDIDRKEFNDLLNKVTNYEIGTIFITNKDRIFRGSYKVLEQLFEKYGTKIVAINDNFNKSDEEELLDDLISTIHCFSMKTYSQRRKNKFKILKEDLSLEKQVK